MMHNKTYYFPNEIWRHIYDYDCTKKKCFNECLQEMVAHFQYNRIVCLLTNLFLKNSFYHNDYLFQNDIYDNSFLTKRTLLRYIVHCMKSPYYSNPYLVNSNMNYFRLSYKHAICCRYCKAFKKKLYICAL